MFERVTIRDVPLSQRAKISLTFSVPKGWRRIEQRSWLAFHPPGRKTAGFTVIMGVHDDEGQALPTTLRELGQYVHRTFPQMNDVPLDHSDEDVFAPYELCQWRGRIDGVGGRVMMLGTAMHVEDISLSLFGFGRDENFDELQPLFQHVIMSFQPLVQSL